MLFRRVLLTGAAGRIGALGARPTEARPLPIWLSPGDTVRLFRACLAAPSIRFLTIYGASANSRSWWDLAPAARRIGYEPLDDAERFAAELGELEPTVRHQGDPFTARDYGGW